MIDDSDGDFVAFANARRGRERGAAEGAGVMRKTLRFAGDLAYATTMLLVAGALWLAGVAISIGIIGFLFAAVYAAFVWCARLIGVM